MQQDSPQAAPPVQPAPPTVSPPPPTPPSPSPPQQPAQASVQPDNFYHPAQAATFTPGPEQQLPQPSAAKVSSDPGVSGAITWQASEYVHNEKGAAWLIGFIAVVVALVAVAVWLGAWTFALIIVVMGATMGFFAFRRPHVLQYSVSGEGITIGEKTYPYHDFRAFGVLEDGAFYTMTFIPVKRFAPALNIYFAEEQGEKIVDLVGAHLPMEDLHPDIIDNIMRRLRF